MSLVFSILWIIIIVLEQNVSQNFEDIFEDLTYPGLYAKYFTTLVSVFQI